MTESEIAAFLSDHLDADVGPVRCVGRGAFSRCFGFHHEGRDLVIRFSAHGDDFERDRWVSDALTDSPVPVPEILAVGEALGGSFAIATEVSGTPIEDADGDSWASLWPALLTMLDRIHAIDLTAQRGFGVWLPSGGGVSATWPDHLVSVDENTPAARRTGWRRKLSAAPEAEPVFEAGYAQLAELSRGLSCPRALVHADTLHGNVLRTGTTITGILDWGSSLLGDPLYDYAWLLFWAPWHPGLATMATETNVKQHLRSAGTDMTAFDERLHACRLHIALDHLSYNAHLERWSEVRKVAQATKALLSPSW